MTKKTPEDGFSQKKIGKTKPHGFSNTPVSVTLTFGIRVNGGNINFIMTENIPAGESPSGVVMQDPNLINNGSGKYYLAITKDTEINIVLANNQNWRWAQNGSAITTKQDYSQFYGLDGGYEPASKSITLYCKARGGNTAQNDGFSLSIELQQDSGAYLPITIDPDIKNPPPGSGIVVDIGPEGGAISAILSADI